MFLKATVPCRHRLLAKQDPVVGVINAKVLPDTISEGEILSLANTILERRIGRRSSRRDTSPPAQNS